MGIVTEVAKLVLEEAAREPFSGSALVLSRMKVFFRLDELETLARAQGVELRPPPSPGLSFEPPLARLGCMDERTFFAALGLDEVVTVDVSDYEGVDLLVDLNQPLPEELIGRFDLVFDGGTIQHVFHLPNLLRNVHLALRPGGRAIFPMAASHNHVDHGFYMLSPTFFHDYFTANAYRIETLAVCEFEHVWLGGRLHTPRFKVWRYEPGALDPVSYGGFGHRQLAIFAVVTRLAGSTCDVVPQQGMYRRIWRQAKSPAPGSAARPGGGLEDRIAVAGRRRPWLIAAAVAAKRLRSRLRRLLGRRLPPD